MTIHESAASGRGRDAYSAASPRANGSSALDRTQLIDRFLTSQFSGIDRHQRRLDKVLALEAAFAGAPEGDPT